MTTRGALGAFILTVATAAPGWAQPYAIPSHVVAGGGAGPSSGGAFAVTDTIGQPVAASPIAAGAFTVWSGFWPGLVGTSLIENGNFGVGAGAWSTFALPSPANMTWQITNGVFEFQRSGTQAVVFQTTTSSLPTGTPLVASFRLGNTDSVRKRISVLLHDADFLDLHVCTFWLPPNLPLTTYGMRTHTTKPWTNFTASFYAASVGTGGFYQLDDVVVQPDPAAANDRTLCLDPSSPAPPGGADSGTLLVNGDFASGVVTPGWTTFGQILWQVLGGVFEFIKLPGQPSGLIQQNSLQPAYAGEILTATFQLGNSSAVRKRVTAILHDSSFADLAACTFWLAPGQALSSYTVRMFATLPWSGATLSIYPATVGADQWMRLDNAVVKRTPSQAVVGTECLEPGASPDALGQTTRIGDLGSTPTPRADDAAAGEHAAASDLRVEAPDEWAADGFTVQPQAAPDGGSWYWLAVPEAGHESTLTRRAPVVIPEGPLPSVVRVSSWFTGATRAEIQVSEDGRTWETLQVVRPSDTWVPVEIDLEAYRGQPVFVRFAWLQPPDADPAAPATWRLAVAPRRTP